MKNPFKAFWRFFKWQANNTPCVGAVIRTKHKAPEFKPRTTSGVFLISIDDGWVEYSYPMVLGGNVSINDVHQRLCKEFNVKPHKGSMRQSCASESVN